MLDVFKILPSAPPSPIPATLPLSTLDKQDGFIHLSTAAQIPVTASLFFTSASELWLLKIECPLVLSYDIICQWVINWLKRWSANNFPSHLRIEIPHGELHYVIPKYHFNGHKEEGHNKYSLNYMPGVGRVCGEQIERTWPKHSEIAGSTTEMGPGSRRDTIVDHLGFTNWRITISFGA